MAVARKKEKEKELEGLGGWLILVGIKVVLEPIVQLLTIITMLGLISIGKGTGDIFGSYTLIGVLILLFPYNLVLAYTFFSKKKKFVKLMYIKISLTIFLVLILAMIDFGTEEVLDVVESIVIGITWSLYLSKSVRVKNTFVN